MMRLRTAPTMKRFLLTASVLLFWGMTLATAMETAPLPSCFTSSCHAFPEFCSCQASCTKYGDCCHDASVASKPPLDHRFSCVRQLRDYWMVTSCSRSWIAQQRADGVANVNEIVSSCENPSVWASFQYLPPVTDERAGLVYRNEYCALCNGLSSADVAGWRVQLSCQGNATALTNKTTVTVSELLHYCTIPFYLAPSTSSSPDMCTVRPPDYLITACPDSASAAEKESCAMGGINVFDFFPNVYANGHCALCWGEGPVDPNSCAAPVATQPTTAPMDLGNLAILFDVFGSGRTAISATVTYSVVQESCPTGSVYDVFRASCRALPSANCTASTGVILQQGAYTLLDSSSVYWSNYNLNVSIESVNTNGRPIVCIPSMQSDACVPIFLDANEYILENATANASVLLLSDQESYAIEGFDMSGRPLICTNFTQNFSANETAVRAVFSYPIAFDIISYIGLIVDILCGTFYLFTFILFKDLRTFFSKLTINFIVSILLGDVIFLIGGPLFNAISVPDLCVTVGILLHYVFLTRFSWMSVMGTELVRSFYNIKKLNRGAAVENWKLLSIYMAIAWLLPLIIVVPTIIVNFTVPNSINYGVGSSCWINSAVGIIVTFVVPVALSILYNTVAFVIVIVVVIVIRNRPLNNPSVIQRRKQVWKDIRFATALFTLTGLSWLFGFLALFVAELSWAWYPFIILNSTEAVAIAVSFLFTKKVFRMYRSLLYCEQKKGRIRTISGNGKMPLTGTTKNLSNVSV